MEDLQIHRWDSDNETAVFLTPWAKGNFSDEEISELIELFQVYLFGFTQEIQLRVTEFQIHCEFSFSPGVLCMPSYTFLVYYCLGCFVPLCYTHHQIHSLLECVP